MGVSLARINIGAETAYVAGVRNSCDSSGPALPRRMGDRAWRTSPL